jgi:hypothetical protein
MTLASDLHWLIREGYVIEFNDGSLDLPRAKPPVAPATDGIPAGTGEAKPAAEIQAATPPEAVEAPVSEAMAEAAPDGATHLLARCTGGGPGTASWSAP